MAGKQFVQARPVVHLDGREGERERLRHTLLAQRRDVDREGIERLESMLTREDQLGIRLCQRGGVNVRLAGIRVLRVEQPHQPQRIAFAGAEHAEHPGGAVAVVLQIRLERVAQLAFAAERFEIIAQPRPGAEAVFPRHDEPCIGKARGCADRLVCHRGKARMIVAKARGCAGIAGANIFQEFPRAIAFARDRCGTRKFRRVGIHLSRQASFSRLTPCGGGMSSGTKKSTWRRCEGSARYLSKSVTPSPARNVSSMRKLPEKLFGLWNTA